MSFPIKYHGTCSSWTCEDPLEPGDFADYLGGDLMHARCAAAEVQSAPSHGEVWGSEDNLPPDAAERAPRPIPTCDTCWMQMPCFCDEERED